MMVEGGRISKTKNKTKKSKDFFSLLELRSLSPTGGGRGAMFV